ncbi:short chain dehydrogenase reductase [Phlyctema vagabunda]|uniref:Short chain dehydrogenase reductase n=1 Tax=Phlyctema vagabunda TaxID=108571 RepID=A0ABR4PDC6_9HELO
MSRRLLLQSPKLKSIYLASISTGIKSRPYPSSTTSIVAPRFSVSPRGIRYISSQSTRTATSNMAAATAPSPVFAKGNLALITGGASGIGLALARRCIDYGMKVLVLDNNGSNLAAAKSSLGGSSVETIEMDVSQIADWSKVREVVEKGYSKSSYFLSCSVNGFPIIYEKVFFHVYVLVLPSTVKHTTS